MNASSPTKDSQCFEILRVLRRRKLKIKKFNLETLLDEHEKIRPMLDKEYKAWDALLSQLVRRLSNEQRP